MRHFPRNSLILALLAIALGAIAQEAEVPEKRVTIYPSYGYLAGETWNIPLKVWVHEAPDYVRTLAARAIRSELADRAHLETIDAHQEALFMARADGFIADSESREQVLFQFDDDPAAETYQLRNADGDTGTDRNGLLSGTITLPENRANLLLAAQKSTDGWLTFRAVSDDHGGAGRIQLVPARGLSIISDIDDTAKVTGIPAGETEVLRNTFFREFRAAPCMAEMYRGFGDDAVFHYVSGGPWQMYGPLAAFLFDDSVGFPQGTVHMKDVRTNPFESESYRDIWRLIAGGSKAATVDQKIGQITTLLEHFPARQFILIGDSGERDPEIFATIRTRFPDRVEQIRIRDVAETALNNPERLDDMVVIPPSDPSGSCAGFPGS